MFKFLDLFCKILYYFVRINTHIGIINIHGNNLKLEKMTEDNIKIIGKIESIEIERTIDN